MEDNINAIFLFNIHGFLTLSSLFSDGRGISEHRQLFLRTGVISQAKGSAYVEQGSTKVSLSLVLSIESRKGGAILYRNFVTIL